MIKLVVTRKFSASHHLPYYRGKCAMLHGHTWKVESVSEGEVDPDTGMLVDFKEIKHVIDQFDHSDLNETLDNPTAEMLAMYLFVRIPHCIKIKVWESEDCYVEYEG